MAAAGVVLVVVGAVPDQEDEKWGWIPVVDRIVDEAANGHRVQHASRELGVYVLYVDNHRRQSLSEAVVLGSPCRQPVRGSREVWMGDDDVLGAIVGASQTRGLLAAARCWSPEPRRGCHQVQRWLPDAEPILEHDCTGSRVEVEIDDFPQLGGGRDVEDPRLGGSLEPRQPKLRHLGRGVLPLRHRPGEKQLAAPGDEAATEFQLVPV